MVQVIPGGVHVDEGGLLRAVDDIAYHHVCSMESRALYVPSLYPLPRDQSHSPLHAARCSGERPQTSEVVSQAVLALYCIWDLRLYQDNEVVIPQLGRLD